MRFAHKVAHDWGRVYEQAQYFRKIPLELRMTRTTAMRSEESKVWLVAVHMVDDDRAARGPFGTLRASSEDGIAPDITYVIYTWKDLGITFESTSASVPTHHEGIWYCTRDREIVGGLRFLYL
jgi:hypothetical protein